ncbi:MAG: insulinase family protein [Proteobacteria bacterium]|nr:insulinase family protein [Pseudomonadota bacterium]
MSKMLRLIALFLSTLLMANCVHAADVKVIPSKSGVDTWLIQDDNLPIIAVRMVFKKAGYAYDPKDRQGLAFMVANLLDKGAGDLDYVSFNKRLEEQAIQLSAHVDADNFYIDLKTLRQNADEAFRLLNMALTDPRLESSSIEQVRKQVLIAIKKDLEDPDSVAETAWNEEVLRGHPYAYQSKGTLDTVASIRRKDILKFVASRLSRSQVLMSMAGNITPNEAAAATDKVLFKLPRLSNSLQLPSPHYSEGREITLPLQVPQSVVLFGHESIKYGHPDFYAAHILNYILGGGGFESRLMHRVRSDKGLAYNVTTYINSFDRGALLQGKVSTRNDAVEKSIAIVKQEFARLQKGDVTPEELKLAKDYLTGSFVLKLDSNEKLVRFLAFMQLENLGTNFLSKRNDYINAVTLEDVNRVAKTLLKPDKLVFVTVGNVTTAEKVPEKGSEKAPEKAN